MRTLAIIIFLALFSACGAAGFSEYRESKFSIQIPDGYEKKTLTSADSRYAIWRNNRSHIEIVLLERAARINDPQNKYSMHFEKVTTNGFEYYKSIKKNAVFLLIVKAVSDRKVKFVDIFISYIDITDDDTKEAINIFKSFKWLEEK